MRTKLILFTLFTLVSCGKNTTKYVENPFDNKLNEERLASLELQVSQLKNFQSTVVSQLAAIGNQVTALTQESATISDGLVALVAAHNALKSSSDANLVRLAALEMSEQITAFVDPYPSRKTLGYDEVLLQTSSGKLLAYFENANGTQRYLTVLKAGNYRTTDSRACDFTIVENNGKLSVR